MAANKMTPQDYRDRWDFHNNQLLRMADTTEQRIRIMAIIDELNEIVLDNSARYEEQEGK